MRIYLGFFKNICIYQKKIVILYPKMQKKHTYPLFMSEKIAQLIIDNIVSTIKY